MLVVQRRVMSSTAEWAPWAPLLAAALFSTLTAGSLWGALNLWMLQVRHQPVPLAFHQGHAFAQLFGFMFLFTVGISLHLAPRFLGAVPPTRGFCRQLSWVSLLGWLLLVAGRFVPQWGSVGLLGSVGLFVACAMWLWMLLDARAHGAPAMDWLPRFLVAGTGWWVLAAGATVVWHLGQVVGGPLAKLPLEQAWVCALVGGTGSWILGVFLRAGACTLRIPRPTLPRQAVMWAGWQLATVALLGAASFPSVRGGAQLLGAAGMGAALLALRPWKGAWSSLPGEPVIRRIVHFGLLWVLLSSLLRAWSGLGAWGIAPVGPYVLDAARHGLALGFFTIVLGFAGRMVPGFEGRALRWPKSFALGAVTVVAGGALRLLEVGQPWVPTGALAGNSGWVLTLGTGLVAASLLGTLYQGWQERRRLTRFIPLRLNRAGQGLG